ncbi:MAG: 3-hydroxybutyryl-CoA dehydrogenase [Bradymonadaceae bacterium]|nr:3-hydroxybutyryl-CoA dehydrogenase [Lujinxingiaceae bacterium]
MKSIKAIGVIGAGQMGNGIAQVAAVSGFDVQLSDLSEPALERARQSIEKSLEKFVAREKMTAEARDQALARITTTTRIADFTNVDLVVEAIVENEDIKFAVFKELDEVTPAHAILASNTSSISITRIAAATKRPNQVIGMHFMNPVPIMALVEIIRGLATDDATYEAVRQAAEKMGKTTVLAQDYPGFIVNRILMPMLNEAVFTLMEGVGSVEDIDAAMKLGTNQPMGPLALADFIGLDTCLAILEVLHTNLGDPKYRPCPLLRKYVDAGWLGRKSGRGFYNY